ncbi:MAG: hypothetical protein K9W44_03985 [Candidatus Lokiarchaeota archaeon]|nr:hypothetical protein [Candidatus Harpocratesius repetitus]
MSSIYIENIGCLFTTVSIVLSAMTTVFFSSVYLIFKFDFLSLQNEIQGFFAFTICIILFFVIDVVVINFLWYNTGNHNLV